MKNKSKQRMWKKEQLKKQIKQKQNKKGQKRTSEPSGNLKHGPF